MNNNEDFHREVLKGNFEGLNDRNKETLLKIGGKFLDINNLVNEETQKQLKKEFEKGQV